ncbi:MAG: hypothetical protein M3R13_06805 [Armatimonadota bacterium]|nr:hypothetical protein [Armatimonadota bacterium]
MAALGTFTRYVIAGGLVVFVILAFIPGQAANSVYATMITPLAAGCVSGIELLAHKKTWPGLSMLASVALAITVLNVGVDF